MQNTSHRLLSGTFFVPRLGQIICGLISLVCLCPVAFAAGTVTDASESALDNALAGGGTVTLAFDGTLTLTSTKTISTDTVLDATGHAVTISGSSSVQIFNVASGASLTLLNLTLADGRSHTNGGAIFNNGSVFAINVVFTNNNVIATNGSAGQNGAPRSNGAAGTAGGQARGGAIYNLGTLSLSRCLFQSNSVVGGAGGNGGNGGNYDLGGPVGGDGGVGGHGGLGQGGAVFTTNSIAITNCNFIGNSATGGNGGSGGLKGTSQGSWSALSGQGGSGGEGSGAAIYSYQNIMINRATFSDGVGRGGNSAAGADEWHGYSGGNSMGGGICNLGTNATLINCTFFNNRVTGGNGGAGGSGYPFGGNGGSGGIGSGGGLYSSANIGVTNCTFSTNGVYGGSGGSGGSAPFPGSAGGAGAAQGANIARSGGTFTLRNSLLAYKATDGNSFGTITDGGRNISSDATPTLSGALGSTNNLDPKLAALANNGGFTKTCALLSTSPAIDTADTATAPIQDQRGYHRGGTADMGAYEYNGISREVIIVANGPLASEAGETGLFTIERALVSTNALTVYYTISGTASNGVDFVTISNSVTIPGNKSQGYIYVRPLPDGLDEAAETVILTLTSSSEYEIAAASSARVTLVDQGTSDQSQRYVRGTGTNANYHSFVVPLDGQTGLKCSALGGQAEVLLPYLASTDLSYHYNATNPASATNVSLRLPFANPIVLFGSRATGDPLYFGEQYRFAAYAGQIPPYYADSLVLYTFEKLSNGTIAFKNAAFIPVPNSGNTNDWRTYQTNGYSKIFTTNGLTTRILYQETQPQLEQYGVNLPGVLTLTHSADASASNYIFQIELGGFTDQGDMAVNSSGDFNYSRLYTLEFEQRPPWRAVFLDQPHFAGEPLPPAYQNKTLDELLTNPPPVTTDFTLSSAASSYTNLDHSSELRRHPILDQFVSDMRRDPVALARYVFNEIELTDAISYNDNGSLTEVSVNPPGVSRGALATYLEGQGGPAEQCALLVYLLRQAGTPAVYVYPPHNGMKLLDSQASRLLRMQFSGAVNNLGQTYTTNSLIPVNYPWVAAYIGTNWVHLFPWLKDTQIEEGLNLRDYMSPEYPNGYKWVYGYLHGRTNILSLATDDDTAGVLFPRWLQNNLAQVAPGVSLDDLGVRFVNRRHPYARWSDFPLPFTTPPNGVALDSLSATAITNVFPGLTNIFDTFMVDVSSRATPSKKISSGEVRMAELHNRRFLIRHTKTGTDLHDLILSLAAFRSAAPGPTNFTVGDSLLNLQSVKTNLTAADDTIEVKLTYKRHRSLPTSVFTNLPSANQNYPGLDGRTILTDNLTIRKGDLAAICINVGRVTRAMLNVHAEDLWNMERTLAADPSATNSLSPDLYQGGTAYLMGMAYFENCSRFQEENARLHKVQVASGYSHGLAKLSAKHVSNALPNSGDIILNQPAVDMIASSTALAFSGTIHPDFGEDKIHALTSFADINIAHGSAEEHQILNSFFKESDSISTVKLLQLAQSRPGPGIQWLNYSNYIAMGNTSFGGVLLKNHDTALWTSVTNFLTTIDARIRQVFITPGVVTNNSNSYKGMGALLISPGSSYAALISGNQNGGAAPTVPDVTFAPNNTLNYRFLLDANGNFTFTHTGPGSSSIMLAPDAFAAYNASGVANSASSGYFTYTPYQSVWAGSAADLLGLIPLGSLDQNFAQSLQAAEGDRGFLGNLMDGLSQYASGVADPVHAVTGEFYIQASDLSLPGPMPLTISRNYSSHNVADNQFGYGWKLNYMPYLSVNSDSNIIYAAEPDGAVLAYEQTATNANLYLPAPAKNPQVSNHQESGIGSGANRFLNRLEKQINGPDTYYYLYLPNGGKRTFKVVSYTGSVNRTRPYLLQWEDSRGNFFTFEYGTDSTKTDFAEVRRIQSSNGSFLGFVYDVYGHIIEAYTGDGRRLKYDYDQFGDLTKVTLPDFSEIGYEYEHKTQSITNGSVVTTTPNSTHLILKEIKPDGRVLKNEYDQHRRVTNQWATVGADLTLVRNATFIYSNNFNFTNSFTNTISGFTLIKDVFNNTNRYDYSQSLITNIVDALGQANSQAWYADSATAPGYPRSLWKTRDGRGLVTEFQYDANGNVTNTIVTGDLTGDGTVQTATNSVAYNADNLPTLITDPSGNRVQTLYHSQFPFLPEYVIRLAGSTPITTNRMFYTSVTNTIVFGNVTYTNLAVGVVQREVRAFGSADAATNDYAYDGRGYVTQSVRYTGTSDPAITNSYVYTDRGELLEQTDAAGRKTKFDYDPLSRPRYREVFEAGQSAPLAWEFSYYNDNGEPTWSDGPRYNPEDYAWRDYDGAGRTITEIRWRSQANDDGSGVEAPSGYSLFAQSFREYDAFGNLKRSVNPVGAMVTNTWDVLGRLVQTKAFDLDGTTVLRTEGFAYEPGGQMRFHTNALNGVTETQYTTNGLPKFRKNADGSTNAWRYYVDGRVYREIQGNGAYWQTSYDDANRKTTRVFYSAAGTPLATNLAELDRRGNLIKRTDAGGFVFTNAYDGLDRIKVSAGPPVVTVKEDCVIPLCGNYVTNILQQKTTYFYDAVGVVLTNVNALGEKVISFSDALGRPTRSEIRDTNNVLVRVTSTAYSADHHSVTVTNGSGSSAVVATSYTDNQGRGLLSIGYPYPNVREYTRSEYDLAGNLEATARYVATNTVSTFFSQELFGYDGLNRLTSKADRDFALTYFDYNALGNVTNRTMPGGLKWQARYNNAGQVLEEKNVGSGGAATLTNTYAYFSSPSPFAGLLQSRTDGVGVVCSYAYDHFLRAATNTHISPVSSLYDAETVWTYDARGLRTGLDESFPNAFDRVKIIHSYDAYGQLVAENIQRFNVIIATANQSWDAAGRRAQLGIYGWPYNFSWRADGLLASVSMPGASGIYSYNTAGILTNRNVGTRSTTVSDLDGIGRPLSITTKVGTLTKLTETLGWTGDGLLNAHTLAREDFTDARSYDYAASSRRLTTERMNLDAAKRWTNAFAFDGGTSGGPGALTKIGPVTGTAQWGGGTDVFSRINTGTNTFSLRSAYGRANGQSTLTATLDGQSVPLTAFNTDVTDWPLGWRATLPMSPGAHQLSVSAAHPSGQFTTNRSVWFTNNVAHEAVTDTYDAAGRVSHRVWKHPTGTTNRTQTLLWDVKGRLRRVTEVDSQNSGSIWVATYDALGRKLFTETLLFTNGESLGDANIALFSYDPAVEFLELRVSVAGQSENWKLYGPDLNGFYGGMNGVGGLEGTATGIDAFRPTISDARGNVLGAVTNGIGVSWNPARPSGYGAPPNYLPVSVTAGASLAQSSAWRGKSPEVTGYIYLGARYYDPESGRFLSGDPVWNDRDPNFYSFVGGDPINGFDPDGRVAKKTAAVSFDVLATIFATLATPQPAPFAYVSPFEQQIYANQARVIQDTIGHPFQDAGFYETDSGAATIRDVAAMSLEMYGLAKSGKQMVGQTVDVNVPDPVWIPVPTVTSPNATMRANANARGSYVDPLTGNIVSANGRLPADHIVPQHWIKQQQGYEMLAPEQQSWLLNHPLNTQPLPQSLNSSKGSQMPGDWTTYRGQPLNQNYIENDSLRGQMLQNWMQQQINTFNSANRNQPRLE